jgi:amidase
VSAPDYNAALVSMRQAAARALVQLHPYDAVLTPTLAQLPALVGELRDDDDPAADFEGAEELHAVHLGLERDRHARGVPAHRLVRRRASDRHHVRRASGEDHLLLALAAQVEGQGPPRPRRAGR